MSYSIVVRVEQIPESISSRWEQEFAALGIIVEIDPRFRLPNWNEPLVFKVTKMPAKYSGVEITDPIEGGFDVNSGPTSSGEIDFSVRGSDPIVDQALVAIGACLLGRICEGQIMYPDNGEFKDPEQELRNALTFVEQLATEADGFSEEPEPFYGWDDDGSLDEQIE